MSPRAFLPRCAPLLGALLLGVLAQSGCAHGEFVGRRLSGPVYQPDNHLGDARLPAALRRVALLPLHGGTIVPAESLVTLDQAFLQELLRVQRFEAVLVSRATMARLFGEKQFSSVEALPHEFLAVIARDLAVDGVLFVDVTNYSPYPPLRLGVRAKLAATATGELVWSFDTIFSAADPAVANAAKLYAMGGRKAPRPPVELSSSVLQSPTQFGAYAAAAAFATLPPR
ncbi:MAG: hypothetical protein HY302_08955 [Opitutae bacterium]|nr:hypothetical protein [Opitutae bacterium]